MFLYFLIPILIGIASYFWLNITSRYRHIPSYKHRYPFFGHFFRMEFDTSKVKDYINSLYKELKGKTGVFWVCMKPILTTMDARHFESVLKSNDMIDKGNSYNLLKGWLGTGLLISGGDLWKKRRRMLTPAFHFNILNKNADVMIKHAKNLVCYLESNISDESFEFSDLIKRFSLGLLCETSMGVDCNCLSNEKNSEIELYIKAIDVLTRITCLRFRFPPYMSERIFKWFSPHGREYRANLHYAKQFTRNVIENRIKSLENQVEIQPEIFLDILISAYKKNEIDIEGIIDEVNTFMFEGHDTVSSAISWTFYLIGRDKRVQNKLYSEIDSFGQENLTFEGLQQLVYAEYVIKESLRLHPPVPMFLRQIKNECTLESNLAIPKNAEFIFHVYQMHRDENNWNNASSFLPERFEDENYRSQNLFTFVPFSAGPRNCIGQRFAMMEMKITLYYLIKKFEFESIQSENELREEVEVIHRAGNGIWVKVQQRK